MQEANDYNLKIRENIKQNRKRLKLSQEHLAEIIDCSREHIARIENGKMNIGLMNFIKLAKVFNITLDELAGFTKSYNDDINT